MSENKKQGELDMSDLGFALPYNTSGLSADDRACMVNALKNKLQSLAGQHTDVMEALTPKVKKRVFLFTEAILISIAKNARHFFLSVCMKDWRFDWMQLMKLCRDVTVVFLISLLLTSITQPSLRRRWGSLASPPEGTSPSVCSQSLPKTLLHLTWIE
ncbi:hypothetical protein MA16_Dca019629 [Dendrobium catenatum]|uniref:Uncharacterized protein n=1 Tax=Dendrobium catenatum TaxID=906689 RepID=A0A2I0V937_9ASPA|nr:hypothetical protein MA16_Dca019629 [Dendrobium catenatum]